MNINAKGKNYLKGAGIVMIIVAAINFIYSLQYILDFNIFVLWGICYSAIYMATGIYGVKNANNIDKRTMNICIILATAVLFFVVMDNVLSIALFGFENTPTNLGSRVVFAILYIIGANKNKNTKDIDF